MGNTEVERIKKKFVEYDLHPTYREHEAVITSEEASKTRGDLLKQGIKALLFTNGKKDFVIVDLPADKKVDQKKVASTMNWSKGATRMATQEEVMEKTGCEIGAVPPFGHKNAIPILVDKGVYENQKNAFNIGLRTKSVKIKTAEMKVLFGKEKVLEGNFVKDLEIRS